MKILIFAAGVLFSYFSSHAQVSDSISPLRYEQVIEIKGKMKGELYKKAKMWLAKNFKDSKEVIQIDDPEGGHLYGRGALQFSYTTDMSGSLIDLHGGDKAGDISGFITFNISIDVKDGKYRFIIERFDHTCHYQSSRYFSKDQYSLGILTTETECPDGLLTGLMRGQKFKNQYWDTAKQDVDDMVKSFQISLQQDMEKTEVDDNW